MTGDYHSLRWMLLAGDMRLFGALRDENGEFVAPDILEQFAEGGRESVGPGQFVFRFADGSRLVVFENGDCAARPPEVWPLPEEAP